MICLGSESLVLMNAGLINKEYAGRRGGSRYARSEAAVLKGSNDMGKTFIVETSARHLHVTREHLETLFGKGYELTHKKDLSQPGQFASEERVEIKGPKNSLKGVSILGPVRKATQIELSATDARSLGFKAPIRESGDIAGSPGCAIIGPNGTVEIDEGVIVAKRHLHLTPADATELGLKDKDIIYVKIDSEDRKAVLGDVVCRVSENFAKAMHIDTDESNAVSATGSTVGEIIKI
jgi:putative phosphotransacetylase